MQRALSAHRVADNRSNFPDWYQAVVREAEMADVGALIHRVLVGREDPAELEAVRHEVLALCGKFSPYP